MKTAIALLLAAILVLGLVALATGCSNPEPPGDAASGPQGEEMKTKVTEAPGGKGMATGGMGPDAPPPGGAETGE
ncbi:MAG: hypothetical protein GF320_22295 [Armatimonadia bacterium]|nr:hypothetical protein [Armatimonadia bacterium]